jgi:N-acetylmuramoyl-L-alanine amidase
MEPKDLLIGVLLRGGYLKTGSGEILLTNIQRQTAVSPETEALDIPPEDMNKAAVVCGNLSGDVLYSARIVETLSLFSSGLVNSLIKKEILTFDEIQKQVKKIEASQKEPMTDKKLCALVIGHKEASPGAVNPGTHLSEFEFNDDMANRITELVQNTNVQKVYREKTFRELPGDINVLDPDFVVSLHCNAFNGKASGTEVLFYHKSKKGEEMAGILLRHLVD